VSTASGLYQFVRGSWGNYKGYRNAKDAPVRIQTQRFYQVFANGKGRSHWYLKGGPQCW
jgi:muramidase (phage lysozyme)